MILYQRTVFFHLLLCILVHSVITTVASGLFVPRVLFESDRILAIDKPPGIAHHNSDGEQQTGGRELGIVSLLREYYEHTTNNNESSSNEKESPRLYGVHRLDRVTSGILLFAKDPEMAGILSKCFRDKTAIKYYIGISNRKPKKKKQGWVKGTMVRGRRKSWYLANNNDDEEKTSASKDGAPENYAVTRFFTAGLGELAKHSLVVDTTTKDENREDLQPRTCVLFRPHTGKTHQLRVAAKSMGLPLLGDPIYADSSSAPSCPRTFLHATAIHLPLDDYQKDDDDTSRHHESVTIWCPPPFASSLWEEDAQDAFDQIVRSQIQQNCESPEIVSALR